MAERTVRAKTEPSPEEIEQLYPGNRLQTLPDCRKDDGKVEAFLKELYRMMKEK